MDSANENTYHAIAQIAAPGTCLRNCNFLFGSVVKITTKNTNKIPRSTNPRKCANTSAKSFITGIYPTARLCRVFPKTRTLRTKTNATRNPTVYTTAQRRMVNQLRFSSRSFTEFSPSVRYWIPFAADQIATTAVIETIPTERLYTSFVI